MELKLSQTSLYYIEVVFDSVNNEFYKPEKMDVPAASDSCCCGEHHVSSTFSCTQSIFPASLNIPKYENSGINRNIPKI